MSSPCLQRNQLKLSTLFTRGWLYQLAGQTALTGQTSLAG
jgi:hypothetical protein